MELYYVIAITDRSRGEAMASLYREAGLPLILTKLGQGPAADRHRALYGLEKEKTVIAAVAGKEETRQLFRAAKRKLDLDIPGNGIMMSVPLKSVAGGKTLAYLSDCKEKGGVPSMEFEHELILVIVNEGYSDCVMEAARSAGAGGGTVLHAKGTGADRAEKFFGVSLAREKDMVYIVAHKDQKAAIMRAIAEQAGPTEPAGAISFSLPVSAVSGLRERDPGEEEL